MIFSAVLAAITIGTNSVTFTATATGVKKGEAVEFGFITKESANGYEALFSLDDPIEDILSAMKKARFPEGRPIDPEKCDLRSVGAYVELTPAITDFITFKKGVERILPEIVFTGGTLDAKGLPVARNNAPGAFFAFFDCPQSPLLFDGLFNQGDVYGDYLSKDGLKKGEQKTFTLKWRGKKMKSLEFELSKTNVAETLLLLKKESQSNVLDVKFSFAGDLTVADGVQIANALTLIDSDRIKINGVKDGNLYYRAFLPLIKWLDRSERLLQPFELTLAEKDKLVFIEENWDVEGIDPKLTEKEISFSDAAKHPKTRTCFIYAAKTDKLSRIFEAMAKFKKGQIVSWYIFGR